MEDIIKLEVGKSYPTRTIYPVLLTERHYNKYLGVILTTETRIEQYYFEDGRVFSNGKTSPFDIIGAAIKWEDSINYSKPDIIGSSTDEGTSIIEPYDVLTDKDGREWECVDRWKTNLEYYIYRMEPKPKALSGFVNVYDRGWNHPNRESADEEDRHNKHKRIACIDLSQFNEGHGL